MLGRKGLYGLIVVLMVAAFAFGGYAIATAGGAPQQAPIIDSGSNTRGITVVGEGKVSGKPDIAHITVGIETQASLLQPAVDENKTKMNVLLEALKAQGIAEKDIQTSNYSVYTERVTPQVSAPAEAGKPASSDQMIYHVTNQVDVTMRDVNQLGDVLDKAVAAGANNIYGVNFSVANTTQLEADARAKAVADARARAEDLARLNGVQLGDVISISEVVGGGAYPMVRSAAGIGGGGTPVQPGELDMTVSLQITYAIK